MAAADAGCGPALLVKRGGLSGLRAAGGAERALLAAVQRGEAADADAAEEDGDDVAVQLSHQMLLWAEAADLGGSLFFSALCSGAAEHVVDAAVRALQSPCRK